MISADTYLQPDAPDPVLETDLVLELARRHEPKVSAVREIDESGGEARVYLLDGELVLKTQRPHRLRPRTSLAKETQILEHLARNLSLPVPRVLGYGRERAIEYILMTRMPGVAVRHTSMTPEARAIALQELGRVLRRLHQVDQSGFDSTGLIPGDHNAADLHARLSAAFTRLGPALAAISGWPADLSPEVVAAPLLASLPTDPPLVVLHSNPGPEHTFVDADSKQFTGIIDFGDAYRSHPALDLRSWAEDADATALLAGYAAEAALPEGFDAVWRAGRVMMEMARAARGLRPPQVAAENIRNLVKRTGPTSTFR